MSKSNRIVRRQVDLTPYNSFAVPATAAWFAEVGSIEELQAVLDHAQSRQLPLQILGGGSNCLFLNDYPGLVLRVINQGLEWQKTAGQVTAAAGENWHGFVIKCMKNGFHGIENLALIPGSVGAAPIQNIGAYGVELQQFFVSLDAIDLDTGQHRKFNREACEFGYRDSVFKRQPRPHYLIWSVTLQLARDWQPVTDYGALNSVLGQEEVSHQRLFDAVCEIRRSKLPDPASLGNAGSFFKNPVISKSKLDSLREVFPTLPAYDTAEEGLHKVPAAWLLDRAGWRGRCRGAAGVHQDHALVIVNLGGASGEDIFLLAQEMRTSVLEKFGITLQPEVKIIS